MVTIEPSSESTVVNEKDGTVNICLLKDKDTAKPFSVEVNPQISGSNTSAARKNYYFCLKLFKMK